MRNLTKEAIGAIAVTLIAVVLFVVSMASIVRVGQSTGQKLRGTASHGHGVPGAAADSLSGVTTTNPDGGVPVLCYHYLRDSGGPIRFFKVMLYVVLSLPVLDDNEVWTQTRGAFEKQMRYLHENGYQTVTLDDLTDWQHGRRSLPPNPVVITFDDGDRSVYDHAWPVLKKYGFTASYFVITKHVGQQWEGLDFLDWSELRELHESGVFAIESHTHDLHYKIGDKYSPSPVFLAASEGAHSFPDYDRWEDKILDDLERSRELIATHVGRAPRHLAWPYGHSDDTVDHLATRAGFDRTCLLGEGKNESFVNAGGDALSATERIPVRRYAISARTSLRTFKRILAGEYESLEEY